MASAAGGSAGVSATSLADAKFAQLQSRLSFLWAAAHSPLAVHCPAAASAYMRQLRLIAFQSDMQLSAAHTPHAFCAQCCAVLLPGFNAGVSIEPSREKRRREKRKARQHAAKLAERERRQAAAAAAASGGDATDSEADSSRMTPRKRARTSVTTAPLTPAGGSSSSSSFHSHSTHASAWRCWTCGHTERSSGLPSRQRSMLRHSNRDIDVLVEQAAEREAAPAALEAAAAAAQKAKVLHSLQKQHAPALPVHKASHNSLQELVAAQARLQASRQAVASGAGVESVLPQSAASSSFFQDQVKSVVGAVKVPSIAPTPAPASAAPFTFSRSGAAAVSAAPKPGVSLYGLFQQSTPGATALSTSLAQPSAPFSFSKKGPTSVAAKPAAVTVAPPAAVMMGGIQIAGGMKASAAAAAAKTYTVQAKAGKKNQPRR